MGRPGTRVGLRQFVTEIDPGYHELLCQNVGFALIGANERLEILFWNKMAEQMFAGGPELQRGRPILEVFPESAQTSARSILDAALKDGVSSDLEFNRRDTAGKARLVTAVLSPVLAPNGARLGVSAALRDITTRRELSHQLSQARRMASLGEMAGGVAHHFNSILGGALTRLDFILSLMKPGEKYRKDLEQIFEAVGRAARISGQLMTFAEGDHGAGDPRDLVDVVTRFIAQVAPTLTDKGVRLVARVEPISPTQVESRRLWGILDSLVHNAVEAMPKGGEIAIILRESEGSAMLSVVDSGCGMSDAQLDRLFVPFFTTKGELGGGAGKNTGLGLSVVHSFITDMGGRISVTSKENEGTRFDIRLPLGAAPEKRRRIGTPVVTDVSSSTPRS